jgi:glycosyltransferase involved in cell wall biosynthesis
MSQSAPPAQSCCPSGDVRLGRRPKLLFLARPFPPLRATACVRTWNIAKQLARLGWVVTIITPHPSVWRHVDSPQETDVKLKEHGIRRILTGHPWRLLLPGQLKCWNQGGGWLVGEICRKVARYLNIDSGVGWIKAAEQACDALSADDVDVILATGSPFAAFRLARRLSKRFGRPYVLDYRDPWTGNPHLSGRLRRDIVQEEASLLANSAAVTIVSPSWGSAMDNRFGLGSKLHVVTNGYDPEELAEVEPFNFGHFAIVYTGNFYPPKRIISPVMAALRRLKETPDGQNREWYFHYYGAQGNHVCEEARQFGLMDRVILHGSVPRREALSAVRGAGVAVIISSVAEQMTVEDKGIVPGKIFETLGLGTPILLIAPRGSDVEAIAAATGLMRSFTGADVDSMTSFLTATMGCRVAPSEGRETYAWPNVVKEMDHVLRAAMGAAP